MMAHQLHRGVIEPETILQQRLALHYHRRQQQIKYYEIVAAAGGKLKPEAAERIMALVVPWDAPITTSDERMMTIAGSSLMGRHVMLDPELCPWQKQPEQEEKEE